MALNLKKDKVKIALKRGEKQKEDEGKRVGKDEKVEGRNIFSFVLFFPI